MKLAMMVHGYLPVPRPKDMIYAPIDLAVAISEGLVKRGHSVDFFAPTGSYVNGVQIESLNLRALAQNKQDFQDLLHDVEKMNHYVPALWDGYMVEEMFKRANAGQYDVLHFHHPEAVMPYAKIFTKVPTVYTLHDPIFSWYRELFELYHTPNQQFISISNNQRRDAPDLPYVANVYNGIDTDLFSFCEKAEDYLLYVGRIVPEKGIKEAVELARKTGQRLLIIGSYYHESGQGYFDQYIKPFLDDKVLYLGYIEHEQIVPYMQKAKAFLMPIQWEEPFGLTMAEAMSCGTPVVAFRRGSVPEIVVDGKTGYIVDSLCDMAEAIEKIDKIDRAACREHVLKNFSIDKMVDAYEAAFEQVLRKRTKRKILKPSVPEKLKPVTKAIRGNLVKARQKATAQAKRLQK